MAPTYDPSWCTDNDHDEDDEDDKNEDDGTSDPSRCTGPPLPPRGGLRACQRARGTSVDGSARAPSTPT